MEPDPKDPKDMPFGPEPEPDDDDDIGELPRDPVTNAPLIDGRPIGEVFQSNPEFFEYAAQSLRRALEKALNVGTIYTPNDEMDWDKIETQGPDDMLEPPSDGSGGNDKDA